MMTCPYPDQCPTSMCALCEYMYGSADAPNAPRDDEKCPKCGETNYVWFKGFVDGEQAHFHCDICEHDWITGAQL